MNVLLNDEPVTLPPEATVAQLLDRCRLGAAACAVEVNRQLIPKRLHAQRRLEDGDRVEVVTLVGGG